MIPGAPEAARWFRSEPRRALAPLLLERIVHTAFPRDRVVEAQPLVDGRRNANFKLRLFLQPEPVVLRLYEHDASLCQKELDLMSLVRGSVPVPEVIHTEPRRLEDVAPFILTTFIVGISFHELKRGGDADAIAQAAYSAGETLAAIGRFTFPQPGWIAPGPTVTAPLLEGIDSMPRFVDLCLASSNLQRRMPIELRGRTSAFLWAGAEQLAELASATCLVHGDFNKRNLMVRRDAGKWHVAAVLDWEFAVSGTPLQDCATFLRYERATRAVAEPHFSVGYTHAGGRLPQGWRGLARLVDLVALCESLTHDDLPDDVVTEIVELLRATMEGRDPQC